MATPTKYTYAVSTDTSNGVLNLTKILGEIEDSGSGITTQVDKDQTVINGDTFDLWFQDALSTSEKTALDHDANPPTLGSLIHDHDGVYSEPVLPVVVALNAPTTADHRLRVVTEKSDQKTTTLYSYDWTDPTTWGQTAIRHVDEVAVDSGDLTTWTLTPWIVDTYHGKQTMEGRLKDGEGNSFRVSVTVNDVTVVEEDPHIKDMILLGRPGYETKYGLAPGSLNHGDYSVDYLAGEIIFHTALSPGDVVKATYHHAISSVFIITAKPGTTLIVDKIDTQFASDVRINDTAVFDTWGYVDVFAPQLIGVYPNPETGEPFAAGDKLSIRKTTYKTIRDFYNDSFLSYPEYAPAGGSGWRGVSSATIPMNWNYLGELPLNGDAGMEVRIYLVHDEYFDGAFATATFYCTVTDTPA